MARIGRKGLLLTLSLLAAGPALAAGQFTNGVPPAGGAAFPSTIPLTGIESIPADTHLAANAPPQSESITTQQLATFTANQTLPQVSGLLQSGLRNALIGGDFGTNLWQRGTSIGVAAPVAYTADRWFGWAGASSAVTVAQDVTAGEVPEGFLRSARVTHGGAGLTPICLAQVVESTSAVGFAGQVPEVDFWAKGGSGFSAAGSTLFVNINYGTGTDEGSVAYAFGLNGGGGGTVGWTGQGSVLTGTPALTTTMARYTAVGTVLPTTVRELAVSFCWTPTTTTPVNDYFMLNGVQLVMNNQLAGLSNSVVVAGPTSTQFERRPQGLETALQQRYFWALPEPIAGVAVGASGVMSSTTSCAMTLRLPVTMRVAPSLSAPALLTATTWRIQSSTVSVLASPFLTGIAGMLPNSLNFAATLATPSTAGFSCQLQGNAGGSTLFLNSEL